ncbi:MAG: hypothetical protein OXK76_02305 [Gammaproteobacteria bacterium]|nr:hypothetical protein [Gammaproteobacteria bacterium]
MAIVPWVGRRGWAGGEPRRTAKRSAGDGFGALRGYGRDQFAVFGRRGLDFFMGSTSNAVLHDNGFDVLAVRLEEQDD